jgi:hypothetical protein
MRIHAMFVHPTARTLWLAAPPTSAGIVLAGGSKPLKNAWRGHLARETTGTTPAPHRRADSLQQAAS